MSHELRTPLNAIIGYSEIGPGGMEDAGQAQCIADLQKIHTAAKHQLGLINDILEPFENRGRQNDLVPRNLRAGRTVREVAAPSNLSLAKTAPALRLIARPTSARCAPIKPKCARSSSTS